MIHGYPRLTRDIDVLIRREDLDRARSVAASAGYTIESRFIRFDVGGPQERHLFRVTKTEGSDYLILDLILVDPFLEDVFRTREQYRVGECDIHVVSREGLRAMKEAAGRPKDLEDLRHLGLSDVGLGDESGEKS